MSVTVEIRIRRRWLLVLARLPLVIYIQTNLPAALAFADWLLRQIVCESRVAPRRRWTRVQKASLPQLRVA